MGAGASQFFLSLLGSLGNVWPSGMLFCVPLTPMCGLDLLDPFLHHISAESLGAPIPCKELGKEMGQPKGREEKGELVLAITGENKQVLEAPGHHPRDSAASLLRPASSSPPSCRNLAPYSA